MCEECGCGNDKSDMVKIDRSVTEANDKIAHKNWHDLKDKKILCINIMGSPGSGKTTVIEGMSRFIDPKELSVIQGDLESDIDKRRLQEKKIDTYQINTHSGCHLDALMIRTAISGIDLEKKKYLIIENVGNLICPAGVKIGQHLNIVISSTTEGADKPKKYPIIFRDSQIIVISKCDLSEMVGFNEKEYLDDIKKINHSAEIFKTSNKDEKSFEKLSKNIIHHREHTLEHKHHH